MAALQVTDLYTLEEYHKVRDDFRAKVLAHKKLRQLPLGPSATLYFEDRLTMQYQVQEMLRIERIFEAEAIEEELAAYNPLIPDGSNFKATFMIEFPDVDERREALQRLAGIEHAVYVEAEGAGRAYALADEDMERTAAGKTSAVHFLRFELDAAMQGALRTGAPFKFGSDHPSYAYEIDVPPALAASLLADLD